MVTDFTTGEIARSSGVHYGLLHMVESSQFISSPRVDTLNSPVVYLVID